MSQIILNLNGAGGLVNRFAGDADTITPQPNLRYDTKDGELAQGFFNPYFRTGYLSPITTSSTTITTDTSSITALNSFVYDTINDDTYWANTGRLIYKGDTSSDTSLTQLIQLPTGAEITDLEIYELDSQPTLYYLYNYPGDTGIKENAIFIGTSVLSPGYGARLYDSRSTITAGPFTSIGLTEDGYSKLSQPFSTSSFANSLSPTITIDGIRAKLRMPFSGTSQTWTLKVGIWTSTLSVLADGSSHYTPVTEVVSTTVDPNTISVSDFKDTYFTLTSTTLSNGTVYCLVLEPTITAEIGTNEGIDWLAGDLTAIDTSSALAYQGSLWFRPTITKDTKFDFAVLAKNSTSILNQTNKTYVDNMLPMIPSYATGNFSTTTSNTTTITVDDSPNNVVFASITIKSASNLLTGVTIGGNAMTLGTSQNNHSATRTYVYYKKSVAAGSNSIVASFSSAVDSVLDGISIINIDTTQTITGTPLYKFTFGDTVSAYNTSSYGGAVSFSAVPFINTSALAYERWYIDNLPASTAPAYMKSVVATPYGADPAVTSWFPPKETGYQICSYALGTKQADNDNIQANYTVSTFLLTGITSTGTSSDWPLKGTRSGKAFMRNSDNGFSYIFSDSAVHKMDGGITGGGAGLLTKDVLKFPSYFQIVDALDYRSEMYIAIHHYPVTGNTPTNKTFSGRCGVVIWNKQSTSFNKADNIDISGAREIRRIYSSPDGTLKLITISDAGLVELREFAYNGVRGTIFEVKKELGIGAFPLFPDSLATAGDKTVWLGNDGTIYSEKMNQVTQLFEVKAAGATTATRLSNISAGALFYGSGDETSSTGFRSNKQTFTFSYLDGATPYVKKVYPFDLTNGSNTAQNSHQGDVYSGVQYIPVTSIVRNLRVYNAPITGTGSTVVATVKLYFNQSATVGMTKTITKDEAKRGYVDFKINKPYLNAIQVKIEWATGITLGSDTYLPSVAVITSDEQKTQSPDNG